MNEFHGVGIHNNNCEFNITTKGQNIQICVLKMSIQKTITQLIKYAI
jgi:hypothetical protein